MEAAGTIPKTILLYVTTTIERELSPSRVPTPVMDPDMMMTCGQGGLELDEELDEPGEGLVWGLRGLLTRT